MKKLLATGLIGILTITAYAQEISPKQNSDGKFGFVDKNGKEVIPFKYEKTGYSFHEGLITVKLGGKFGFINEKGTVVIPFK